MKHRFLPSLIAALLLNVSSSGFAVGPVLRPTSVPVVISVETDKITIQNGIGKGMKVTNVDTNETKPQTVNIKTYTVNKFTEIVINGRPMKLTDIKPGMPVRVIAGTDPKVASRIEAKADPSVVLPAGQ